MDLTNDNNKENENNSISSDLIRGHINTIILRTLYDGDKYGYEIINEIEEKSKGQYSLKQPTLYSALKRLEGQDYVTSYWGGVSNGGRRKYFQITDKGKKIVEQNLAEWEYSRTVIDSLISQKDYDFSNPPPSAVDFNILKKSTTRVPLSKGEVGKDDEVELGFDFSENSDTDNENEDFEKNHSFEDKAEEHGASDKIDDDLSEHETAAQETAFREERLMREEIASDTVEQPAQSAVDDSEETRQEETYSVQTEENDPPLSEEEKQRIHENYKKLVGDDEDASNYYYAQVANRNKQKRIIETNSFIAEETVSAEGERRHGARHDGKNQRKRHDDQGIEKPFQHFSVKKRRFVIRKGKRFGKRQSGGNIKFLHPFERAEKHRQNGNEHDDHAKAQQKVFCDLRRHGKGDQSCIFFRQFMIHRPFPP